MRARFDNRWSLLLALALLACGDDEDGAPVESDAAVQLDAASPPSENDASTALDAAITTAPDATEPDASTAMDASQSDAALDASVTEADATVDAGNDAGSDAAADAASNAGATDAGDASASDTGDPDAAVSCEGLSYENFGRTFIATYCTTCHAGGSPPRGYDFTTQQNVRNAGASITIMAVNSTAMPADAPFPSSGDRQRLGVWLRCGAL